MSTNCVTFAMNILETVIDTGGWFQRTTNRKWSMGIKCSRDRWRNVTRTRCP